MLLLVSLGSPFFQLAKDGTLAAGLYVVQPLTVVANAPPRASLHEF